MFVSLPFNSAGGMLPIQAVTVAPVISKMASIKFRTQKGTDLYASTVAVFCCIAA